MQQLDKLFRLYSLVLNKQQYFDFFDKSHFIIMVLDKFAKIKFVVGNLEGILHYKAEEVVGKNLMDLVSVDSMEILSRLLSEIGKVPLGGSKEVEDVSLNCSYCYKHYFDGSIANMTHDPLINGYVFYLHNVTERKKVENELKDLTLELDSFIYRASHDLKSPLKSILGLIKIAELDFPDEAAKYFVHMKSSLFRLDQFITQLTHYTRNSKTIIADDEINFNEIFQETIDTYKYLKNSEKIRFELKVNTPNKLFTDSFRLKVILNNLISNAIKYSDTTKKNPYVKVIIEASDDDFLITIKDNGIGISKESQKTVFDMFVRATDTSDGSGLGLYIVHKALEKIKGEISLKSLLGKGTSFTLKVQNRKPVLPSKIIVKPSFKKLEYEAA